MPQLLLDFMTVLAMLGCGLVAGIFLAFSNFVMRALARLPDAGGIAAMQAINVTVLNPLFLGVFLGTAVACAMLAGYGLLHLAQPGSAWLVAGALSYLLGNLAVTGRCNVPRNHALARIDPASVGAAEAWRDYVRGWTAWNHVRTLTALAASAAFAVALWHVARG